MASAFRTGQTGHVTTSSSRGQVDGSTILVTGHLGMVGRVVSDTLTSAGGTVIGCDRADGCDVTDPSIVGELMSQCDAVVHLAALDDIADPSDPLAPPTTGDIPALMATNVAGTANVLRAAEQFGVQRVVFMSSVDVLGCFLGLGSPDYFPIDDEHPVHPRSPYAWSKLAAEELCAAFTRRTGIPSLCLRPPGVFTQDTYRWIRRARTDNPEVEWSPIWEYGAFIDVQDLADAVLAALTVQLEGHHRLLVGANDISSAHETSLSLADRLHPDVPVADRRRFITDPYRGLLDTSRAHRVLQWTPTRNWRTPPTS